MTRKRSRETEDRSEAGQSGDAEVVESDGEVQVETEALPTVEQLKADAKTAALATVADALILAGSRPEDDDPDPSKKIVYAARFSGLVAVAIENGLKAKDPALFGGAKAGEETVGAGSGLSKKVDVLLATAREGMKLNVSVKTQSFRDYNKKTKKLKSTKAYCHNITRVIDQELQLEAKKNHQLFPHGVLAALIVFPRGAWFDANPKKEGKRGDSDCSSAAEFAQRLRRLAGRDDLRDSDQESKFEAIFIATHGLSSPADFKETVAFFDVLQPMPHNGLPDSLLTYDGFLEVLRTLYNDRWAEERDWTD